MFTSSTKMTFTKSSSRFICCIVKVSGDLFNTRKGDINTVNAFKINFAYKLLHTICFFIHLKNDAIPFDAKSIRTRSLNFVTDFIGIYWVASKI